MIASRVTSETLHSAARLIGVQMDRTNLNPNGTRHRVKLYPDTPQSLYKPACGWHKEHYPNGERPCRCRRLPGEQGDAKYQRTDTGGNDRRVHAVCWHGFRDFFRAVYRVTPNAKFITAMDTWQNAQDFEARFRETGHKNIGSQMCPMAAAEACRCPESGSVGPYRFDERDTLPASDYFERMTDPVSLTTVDMGVDDALVTPEGITVERWATYNKKMNDLLMGRV
jgi:hypothetical protein